MRSIATTLLCFGLIATACCAGQGGTARKPSRVPPDQQWEKLIDEKRIEQAKALCSSWVKSADLTKQIEAQKCLANVALARGSQLSLQGNEVGGGSLGEGYTPKAVDEALEHLNEGIRLAPQDVSLHQGRLHVLEVSGRFDAMAKALDESIGLYHGPGTPDIWLAYAAELADDGDPTAGLHISEVLEKHYPENSDVIGNLGAFHNMLKQWDQGLPYERRAVELNPTDPVDTWNLGWTLDHLDQTEEADKWMSKSISLGGSDEQASERKCLYGQFLVTKMKKTKEGCALVISSCETQDHSACEAQPAKPKTE